VVVALRAGGSPIDWLENPRALMSALEILEAADRGW
jgi:hypothetical protein